MRCLRWSLVLVVTVAFCATAAPPQRVVAVGGDITETVYALGAQDALVGADTTSVWPAATEALPKVGYQRNLSPEGVLSLSPDLVLASPDAGPESALNLVEQAGVAVKVVPGGSSPAGVKRKVRFVGEVFGREDDAEALVARMERRLGAVRRQLDAIDGPRRRVLLLLAADGGLLAAGRDTAADAIIRLAGGENVAAGFSGYKPLSREVAIAAAPEVIVVPGHAMARAGGRERLRRMAGLAQTPAGREGRIVEVDSLLLLGFGPRLAEATERLARHLYPDRLSADEGLSG